MQQAARRDEEGGLHSDDDDLNGDGGGAREFGMDSLLELRAALKAPGEQAADGDADADAAAPEFEQVE